MGSVYPGDMARCKDHVHMVGLTSLQDVPKITRGMFDMTISLNIAKAALSIGTMLPPT